MLEKMSCTWCMQTEYSFEIAMNAMNAGKHVFACHEGFRAGAEDAT